MKIAIDSVTIVEVGPRDGLQNEKVTIPTEAKVAYITALGDAVNATSRLSGLAAAGELLVSAEEVEERLEEHDEHESVVVPLSSRFGTEELVAKRVKKP